MSQVLHGFAAPLAAALVLLSGTAHAQDAAPGVTIENFWQLPPIATARTNVGSTTTGDASFSVDLELPASRFSPKLSMSYSAQGGDDRHLGHGWRLDVPTISLNPTPGTTEKRFGPDGALQFVAAAVSPPVDIWRAVEDQGGAARQYARTRGTGTWSVTGKSGVESTFKESGPDGNYAGFAVLTRQVNAFGDEIVYSYDADGLIRTIQYGGNVDGEPAEVEIEIVYSGRGCDPTDYRFTPPRIHDQRVRSIAARVNGVAVRRWDLAFASCPDRLTRVDEFFLDGTAVAPRTTRFDYSDSSAAWTQIPVALSPIENPLTNFNNWVFGDTDAIAYTGTFATIFGLIHEVDRESMHRNGDPLLDIYTFDQHLEGDFVVTAGTTTGQSAAHTFATRDDVFALDSAGLSLSSAGTVVPVGPDIPGPLTVFARVVDVDGDGESDSLRVGPLSEFAMVDVLPDIDAGQVEIAWGGPDSGLRTVVNLPGDITNLGDSFHIDLREAGIDEAACQRIFGVFSLCKGTQTISFRELLDWNADGYVDLVSGDSDGASVVHVNLWDPNLEAWSQTTRTFNAPWCDDLDVMRESSICGLRLSDDQEDGESDQYAGIVDMNGDGLPDFVRMAQVDSGRTIGLGAPWIVYLNTGNGFDGGINWGSQDAPRSMLRQSVDVDDTFCTRFGFECGGATERSSTKILISMADVNGDGLIDVLDAARGRWWENTGDPNVGLRQFFLPSQGWNQLERVESFRGGTDQDDITVRRVADWTGDGAVDMLDAASGTLWASVGPSYLLNHIDHETGYTDLDWVSSSELPPSGDQDELQHNHVGFSTLRSVTETDPVTGKAWTVEHHFENGVWDPIRRRFVGFGLEWLLDDDGHLSRFLRHTTEPFTGLEYQADHGYFSGLPRVTVTTQQSVVGTVFGKNGPIMPTYQAVTERPPVGSDSRTRSVEFGYDTDGNMVRLRALGEDEDSTVDDMMVEVEWAHPGRFVGVGAGLALPCVIKQGGVLPGDVLDVLSERRIEYDNQPLCHLSMGATSAIEDDRFGNGIDPTIVRTEYEVNDYGQIETEQVAGGQGWKHYLYDPTQRYADTVVNAVGHTSFTTQDVWGRETSSTSPSGVTVSTTRDGRGRPVAVARQGSIGVAENMVFTTYVDGGAPSITTKSLVSGLISDQITQYLDSWGMAVQTRQALANNAFLVRDFGYNPSGASARVAAVYTGSGTAFTGFNPSAQSTLTEYDPIGRWKKTTDVLGNATVDASIDAWHAIVKDPELHEVHKVRDGLGRLREVFAARNGNELDGGTYLYDALGRMLSATDPDGVVTSYDWASTGELLGLSSSDIGQRTFAYDVDGFLVDQYDNAGHHVHYDRDAIGRVVDRSDADVVVEHFDWDTLQPGLLTAVVDAAGSVEFQYDGLSRLTQETRTFPDATTAIHDIAYDGQDRVVTDTQPDGVVIGNQYANGRLVMRSVSLTDGRTIRFQPRYDVRGRFRGLPVADVLLPLAGWKLSLALDIDDLDRTTGIHWRYEPKNNPPVVVDHTYGYKLNGLIDRRSLSIASQASTYAYDPAGRIRAAQGRGAATWNLSAGGFATERTGLEARVFTPPPGPNTHQIQNAAPPGSLTNPAGIRWAYDHDAAGNVIQIRQVENQKVKDVLDIVYDGLGRPVFAQNKKANDKGTMTRLFSYDGSVAYEVVDGKVIKRFAGWESVEGKSRTMLSLFGINLGRVEKGDNLVATMVDLHGTPTKEINEKGVVASSLELDPYGVAISATGNSDVAHQWLGLPRSEKLGLVSTGARLYDERSRAFLSPDPVLVGFDAPRVALDAYSTNPFAYSRWNGLNLRDPNGREGDQTWMQWWDQTGSPWVETNVTPTMSGVGVPMLEAYSSTAREWIGDSLSVLVAPLSPFPGAQAASQLDTSYAASNGTELVHASMSGAGTLVLAATALEQSSLAGGGAAVSKGEYSIVRYSDKAAGFENHHGVLDKWATENVEGYVSRAAGSPTIRLSQESHAATKQVFRDWLTEQTGKPVGGRIDWAGMSARDAQGLTERMFDAASVPPEYRAEYYSAFNQYTYTGQWGQ